MVPVLEDLPDPSGKAVLVRATFDRPLGADLDQPMALRRVRGLGATLEWLVERADRVTVCGNTEASDAEEEVGRLERIREAIEQVAPGVTVADTTTGIRSSSEDPEVIRNLVTSHDLFVNDTLQDSALPMPSVMLPAQGLPSAAGRTLQHDLECLDRLLIQPERPFVTVLGGERSFGRLHGLQGLVLRADNVLLGGAMGLPMLQALGKQSTKAPSQEFFWECRNIMGLAGRVLHQIMLPADLMWWRLDGSVDVASLDEQGGDEVVDIGPLTRTRFGEVLGQARSVLWVGALGRVEDARFAEGTRAVATSLPADASTIFGGDALVGLLDAERLLPAAADVLSATDAAIELLKNGDLPALAALRRRRGDDRSTRQQ